MEREPPPPRMGIFSRIFPVENPAGVLCWFDLLRGVKPVADHVSISAYKRVINLPPRPAAGVGCFMLSGQEPARVILQCGSLVPISSPPSFFPPFPTSAFFPPPPPTIFHRSPLVELQTSYQTPRQLSWEEFMRPVKRRWTPAAFLMTKFRDSPRSTCHLWKLSPSRVSRYSQRCWLRGMRGNREGRWQISSRCHLRGNVTYKWECFERTRKEKKECRNLQ